MPKWVRDFLLLPLIVGLVVAGFTIGLPKLFEEDLKKTRFQIRIDSQEWIITKKVDFRDEKSKEDFEA